MEDTLFIVLEEDFRLYQQGEPLASDVGVSQGEEFLSDPGAASSGAVGPQGQDLDHRARLIRAQWTARLGKPSHQEKVQPGASRPELDQDHPCFVTRSEHVQKEEFEPAVTDDLRSMVRLCTAAHRLNVGDIVWFSWNSHATSKPSNQSLSPDYGSQGVAVSVRGARSIKHELAHMSAYHWDVEVLERLRTGTLRGCYIYPACGHFVRQRSGILKNDEERAPTWGAWFVQEGVNPKKVGDLDRQIWVWNQPGQNKPKVQYRATVFLNHEEQQKELRWKTYFKKDISREPLASEYPFTGPHGPDPPPPAPLNQEEMKEMYDYKLLVARFPTEYESNKHRGPRDFRKVRGMAMKRVFTQRKGEVPGMLLNEWCVCETQESTILRSTC